MKKKIALLLALIMLLGSFSMLTFPTSAQEYAYLEKNTDYQMDFGWIGTKKVHATTPFSGIVELDEKGIANFSGWIAVNGGVSGYKYSVDGGELIDVEFPYIYNPTISSVVPGYDEAAYNTAGFSMWIDLSGYEAGQIHTIKLYAVCASDANNLCEMLDSQFKSAYFGYNLIDEYLIMSWDPNDDTNIGNEYEKADTIFTVGSVPRHAENLKGIPDGYKFGLYAGGNYARQFLNTQIDFLMCGSVVVTYMTNCAEEGTAIQVLNVLNQVYAELPIVPTANEDKLSYRQGIAATEKTAAMTINRSASGAPNAPRWDWDTETSEYVVITSIKLLNTSYEEYVATLVKMQGAESSVDKAITACDGLVLFASDASKAQASLDRVIKANLDNEDVTVSYANEVVESSKYSVDVTYTIEGKSYTDNVEAELYNTVVVSEQDITTGVTAILDANIELDNDDNLQENLVAKLKELLGNDAVTVTVKNYTEKANSAIFDIEFSIDEDSYTLNYVNVKFNSEQDSGPEGEQGDGNTDQKPDDGEQKTDDAGQQTDDQKSDDAQNNDTETQPITEDTSSTEEEKGGCGSSVTSVAFIVILVLTVLIFRKKRKVTE